MGDFSAQAVINTILKNTFPDDPIVGEEDAADLRVESGKALRERIVQLANETLTAELLPGEKEEWGLGAKNGRTTDELLDAIDRGNYEGGRTGRAYLLPLLHASCQNSSPDVQHCARHELSSCTCRLDICPRSPRSR